MCVGALLIREMIFLNVIVLICIVSIEKSVLNIVCFIRANCAALYEYQNIFSNKIDNHNNVDRIFKKVEV